MLCRSIMAAEGSGKRMNTYKKATLSAYAVRSSLVFVPVADLLGDSQALPA